MQKKGKVILAALFSSLLLASLSGCEGSPIDWVKGWFQKEEEPAADLRVVTDTTFCDGVIICGVNMGGRTKEQALAILSRSQQEPESFSITLKMDEETYQYTEADFTIDSDYETAIQEAYDYLYYGTPMQYYGKKFMLSQYPKEFGASQSINKKSLETKLNALCDSLDKDVVEPNVLSFNGKRFTFSDGETGISVNRKKLIADVESALQDSHDVTVKIDYKVTKPKGDKKTYAGVMQKLGTFSTTSTNNENGNLNMKLALDYVNGTTIGPGETFSFNEIVGDSTNDSRGFVKAGAIVNGKLEDSYGGGICQASTTIYGAVIRSDLTIVERNNHMWPSSYVPIGQDAAIDYGIQDFQFRNDTDYPVYIQCGMEGSKLTATIYGYQSPEYDEIEITSDQTGTLPVPDPVYELDNSLKKGEIETDREAREGQTASAQAIYYKNGKQVKTKDLPSSYYPAIGAIYRYGPGTKLDR
ncbi:MAG: VanW family protein [Oscillospiraceae bacterium]|nr:VanW family protein [Oscillospiraceae bacterium]